MEGDDQPDDDARAQAALWLARLKTLPVSRETLDGFFAWRRAPANAAAFDDAEQFWSGAETLRDRPSIIAATEAALAQGVRSRPSAPRPYLLAVMVVLLALGGALLFLSLARRGDTFRTAVGERRMIQLADGSAINLDTDTQLAVRFRTASRSITLTRGQAFFSVAHDASRPFTVHAGRVDVVATGTKFDVRRSGAIIAVTLVEGAVDVGIAAGRHVRLAPGQQWRYGARRHGDVVTVNAADATAWRQGRLVFDAQPLSEAIAEVNRYATTRLTLAAPAYASVPVSGSFQAGDPDSFIRAVTILLPLKLETAGTDRRLVVGNEKGEKK